MPVAVRFAIATFFWACLAGTSPATAGVGLHAESRLVVDIRPLAVEEDATRSLEPVRLDLRDGEPRRVEVPIRWSTSEAPSSLVLTATAVPGPPEGPHRFELRAEVPGLESGIRERVVEIREGSTSFFEALSDGTRRVTLALGAERTTVPVVTTAPLPGRSVRFIVGVDRILEGNVVPLESNDLHTFVGEPVEYMFRRGAGEELENLRLVLRPVRLRGDLAEVDARFEGSLQTAGGTPLYVSRRQALFTNRGAVSEFDAVLPDVGNGYRFRVVALF